MTASATSARMASRSNRDCKQSSAKPLTKHEAHGILHRRVLPENSCGLSTRSAWVMPQPLHVEMVYVATVMQRVLPEQMLCSIGLLDSDYFCFFKAMLSCGCTSAVDAYVSPEALYIAPSISKAERI